jgi:YD repeat-containing protein
MMMDGLSRTTSPSNTIAKRLARVPQAIAAVIGMALSLSIASPAQAQSGLEPPSAFQTSDRFGVDVVSGSLSVSSPTISVGDPAHGGLSFTATWDTKVGAWRYSNWGEIKKELAKPDPNCFAFYTLVYMGGSNIFQRENCTSNNFDLIDGHGSLVAVGSGYTYTALDGSVATYSSSTIQTIVRPNGEVITYSYSSGELRSVSNNLGYQLHFDGGISKVTALNNAVDACALTAATCTYSRTWPSLTFTQSGLERQVTDSLGRTTRITLDSTDPIQRRVSGVSRPTTTSGSSVTYTYAFVRGYTYRVVSATDGDGTWTYDYETYCPPVGFPCEPMKDAYDVDTTVTDPNGGVTVYNIFYTGRSYWTGELDQAILLNPSLYSIKNPLNQTTLVSQDGMGLHSATYPEGNSIGVSRNDLGNVTQIHNVAKSGSGLSDTYVTAVYPDCATEPVRCHFPTSVTDARGNTTDYTYDAAGNLLTETGPAPTAGAPRPQTRYTWEQRYAWYKRNGSSSITQAASPVWVMVEQSQCMTGATC